MVTRKHRAGRPRSETGPADPLIRRAMRLIERSGQTYSEIEAKAGVSKGFISRLKHGHSQNPSIMFINWLLIAIGHELTIRKRGRR